MSTIGFPGDETFGRATRVFNLAAPPEPAAAVTATTIDEIRAALRYAAGESLSVRVQGTGHGSATVRPVRAGLLIRTELCGGVDIDKQRRTARIPAGTQWGTVVDAAAAHGLAAPHGSSPLVGAVGYLLRGGVSFYGRHVGVAANSVRAIELVTADGEERRVSGSSDPELFWALRGGGGGFGVVTAVEIDLFPMAGVITGATYFSAAHAEQLLPRWLRWTADAPWEVTTSLRVMRLPELPIIPPVLSAGPVLCVDGAVIAESEEDWSTARHQADELLEPLRAVAQPLMDTWQPGPLTAVSQTHMDPVEPFPMYGDHLLLNDLGSDGAEEFLRVAGQDSGSPLTNAELRQLGGALAVPDPAGGALDHFDAPLSFLGGGVPFGPVTPEAIFAHCAKIRTALTPWDTGRTAPTFVENFEQPQGHLSAEQIVALDTVRSRVDPAGVFRGDISANATA